ncbi:MAG: hypothetical protein DI533_08420 [Cereibacter sphaeroides]|uniref:Uncharacterized protein n=1 Tax=Cereibacter sphaeroides TaxID=1063 RepID=A0A2W5UCN8_CERSP|nr:MAG: hypothetical protein DI533_08420 [Cereibacter sphaeroides]
MGDPNLRDFYGRISRIEEARANGYGFEAPGTIGLSHYTKTQRRRRGLVGPLFVAIVMALALKGVIHYKVGAATYEQRVESLMAGQSFDRLGGWLMQADPATLWVSQFIREMTQN